ncbi:MAG: hypothetical protein ACE5IJ_04235 [Thermoplasmata archaeon]
MARYAPRRHRARNLGSTIRLLTTSKPPEPACRLQGAGSKGQFLGTEGMQDTLDMTNALGDYLAFWVISGLIGGGAILLYFGVLTARY